MSYTRLRYATIILLGSILLVTAPMAASLTEESGSSQVLVRVGNRDITALDLQRVVASSPVATQFNTMEEDEQAMIRGRMLKNLIYSEMLYQEGIAEKVDRRPEVEQEVESYRRGVLYQQYLLSLRGLVNDAAEDSVLKERLKGEADALAATRAASKSQRFADLKKRRLLELGDAMNLRVFRQPLAAKIRAADALLAKGDRIEIRLGDLIHSGEDLQSVDSEELLRRLDGQVERQLMVDAAERAGVDVSARVGAFRRDLIRQIVMQEKERAWVPDRATLRDYYQAHPALSRVPEQWQVGQLVVATRAQAEALRQRIVNGESLYRLAGEFSIDPYGRQHAGDMGWVRPDEALEPLREVLEDLPLGEVSQIVESPRGFHLVIVEARKPGEQKPLDAVAGGIRRSLILDRLAEDYVELSRRYPIQWYMRDHQAPERAAAD